MRKLLIVLSGARPEILEHCPSERGKFEGIGGAVLTTSVLATVSMAFALHSALGAPLYIAVPASVIWGLAIMSLDRWLVGSIQTDGPRRWRLAVPRILMAVLLGVVISTPLVLQIFKSEIDAQIVEMRQSRADSFAQEQERGTIGKEVARLRASSADLQKVIASGGEVPQDPAKDPRIRSLTAERDAQQVQAKKHYDEWQCQLYGGPACPRKGDGVLSQASRTDYFKAKSRVDRLNRQIEARKRELTATDTGAKRIRLDSAREELPKVRTQLDAAVRRQNDLQASFDAENSTVNGLLIRLRALNEVSGKDLTLNGARLLLFLLFLLIECLPVAVKLMQKPGNYEKVQALVAQREFREARKNFTARSANGVNGGSASIRAIWTRDPSPDQHQTTSDPGQRNTTSEQGQQHGASDPGQRHGASDPGQWNTAQDPGQWHSAPGQETGRPDTIPESSPDSRTRVNSVTLSDLGPDLDPDPDHGSMEDEALRREMADSRTASMSDSRGPRSERSRGIELFPDDDQ
ncbi:DUF4407 domain-containing protein [Sphaerisporangium corydalis]|uniref:DUF4407 domain-containing protein n=1 Tax=Sphaerisporangium corydalis TaxID=1441875 RepID=A0ABV9EEZ2_9ACTN|nr:DUF4407 domain-containing protein [Sphaerisporangium corydalis]